MNVVFWTWQKHRVIRTKAQYSRIKRHWKDWYERRGWTVRSFGDDVLAISPDGERHSIGLRVIDVERVREINGV